MVGSEKVVGDSMNLLRCDGIDLLEESLNVFLTSIV